MKVDILGAYGGNTVDHHMTNFIVDDFLAVDAGCITSTLTMDRQSAITDVVLSHAHIDHIGTLPLLVDNLFDQLTRPLMVWASQAVIDALKAHVFNEVIWPDFSRLPNPESPAICFNPIEPGVSFQLSHLKITPVPVNHLVPCYGYLIESIPDASAFLYSADTCSTDAIWELGNACENLKAVIVDCSFPNHLEDLARSSRHMTPRLLGQDLKKLDRDVDVYVYHIKPTFEAVMRKELAALDYPRLHTRLQSRCLEL